jgi:hypothetical protein
MRRLSRLSNEYAAKMVEDYPGRYGLFASLPMPDIDGSLEEIEYAFDTLKADGINLSTSFGDKWPGDPAYKPVFEELNRRKAIVFFHPYAPNCCARLDTGVPDGVLENPYDTGRAITSLLYSGSLARLRDIRWLFSHGGGVMPMLAGGVSYFAQSRKDIKEFAPEGVSPSSAGSFTIRPMPPGRFHYRPYWRWYPFPGWCSARISLTCRPPCRPPNWTIAGCRPKS